MAKKKQQSLEDVLMEAEARGGTDCVACKVAAGIGITKNLCEEFKHELDCGELAAMIDNPELYTLREVEDTIENIAKTSHGKPRELLDYTLCLMKGKCSLDDAPVSLKG